MQREDANNYQLAIKHSESLGAKAALRNCQWWSQLLQKCGRFKIKHTEAVAKFHMWNIHTSLSHCQGSNNMASDFAFSSKSIVSDHLSID